MAVLREVYAGQAETPLYANKGDETAESSALLGTWLGVLEVVEGWLRVEHYDEEWWVQETDTREDPCLKIFYVDVGQGDGCLIETPSRRILVDGGPNQNLRNYLSGWKYDWMMNSEERIRFDAVFVSHFDWDHFNGLISILNDDNYEFGTLYHTGIPRFHKTGTQRPDRCDTELGRTDYDPGVDQERTTLLESFDDIEDAEALLEEGGLMASFRKFLQAAVGAHAEGRLERVRRLTYRDGYVPHFGETAEVWIRVLGPVTTSASGHVRYHWFDDNSHTVNGHSLVLRLEYGSRSFLLGGDLNIQAEDYLVDHYHFEGENPFHVDVTKACHHGASEFTIEFMQRVAPRATVISSGDNENYAHPRADAVGCAGRYARGDHPLVFSTELSRSYKSSGEIHYGNINLRTDGDTLVIAHMYEKKSSSDPWDSYILPDD